MRKRSLLWWSVAVGISALGCGDNTQAAGGGGALPTAGQAPVGGFGGEGGQGGAPTDPRFDALIAAVEAELDDIGAPGVAVAVIENGEVTLAKGFGSKAPGGSEPVLPTTLFRIGSVNKVLTTTALLKEVAAGDVDLAAPVVTYVPNFELGEPEWAPSITVRHLLTHSSGMADYLRIDVPGSQQGDLALESYVTGDAFASNVYLMNPAGAFWNYSNPNFYLAGLVTEQVTGNFYRDDMQAVFDPLGMSRTFFLAEDVLADGDYATGKTSFPDVDNPVLPDSYENAWARPAGYATSNVLDLAKFVIFMMQGDDAVLPEAQRMAMQVPQINMHNYLDLAHYGYGLIIEEGTFVGDDYYELRVVSHGGDIPGFAADIMFVPSTGFGLVTLSNADGAHFRDSSEVALATLGGLPAASEAPAVVIDPETFDSFAGVYQDDFNVGTITVTRVGDSLEIEMPDLDDLGIPYDSVLDVLDPENFLLTVQGSYLQVTFLEPIEGATRYLRTRAFVGIRPEAGPPPPGSPIPPAVRRARLSEMLTRATLEPLPRLVTGGKGR